MACIRGLGWMILILSAWLYRSGSVLKNVLLTKTRLPVGYAANADYTSDCQYLGPGEAQEDPFNSLAYCEDTGFWEHRDSDGKTSSRLVLFSCDPNRKSWNTVMGPLRDPNPRGALWVYAPTQSGQPASKPQRITLQDYPEDHDFHPLGFEAWPSYGGNASNLYVINHARRRTVIEQFLIRPSEPTVATHVRTISSLFFVAPNGLALTSPDSFYVTNDHLFTRRWPIIGTFVPLIESILGLPLAFVSHITLNPPHSHKGAIAKHKFAASFLPFPNGVAISEDGKRVAVALSSLAQVRFFERNPQTNSLKQNLEVVRLPFTPDNVRFTPSIEGPRGSEDLIVGGHPHFPSLSLLAKGAKDVHSGSWVVSIVPKVKGRLYENNGGKAFDGEALVSTCDYVDDGPTYTLKTLFQSDGSPQGFATATTGIRDPETGVLYISGLYDPHGALVCTPKKP
ncbi:arylesterase [Coprinopsis marcescibilis]|uniref:Arylesterase n=1 Tax=Coprinopsis marcescibilis TaxID=230819 RepID=A0A5C3L4Z3_COPMA|nr:arylesterase [Coprinopsis marcescibilis]